MTATEPTTTETSTTNGDFPAMPNLAAEHIMAVRQFLNGGRTTQELEALRAGRFEHPSAFDADDIRAIRARRRNGEYLRSIAIDYGIQAPAIGAICRHETYKWVVEP